MSLVEVLSDERICRRVFSYLLMTTRLHVADQLCCCTEDHPRISPVELHLLSSRLLQWTYQYDMTFHNSRGMSNDWYTISFSHLGPMDMASIMFSHRLLTPRESIWKPIRSGACFFDDGTLPLLMLSGSPADSLFSFATSLLNHWRSFSLPSMEWLRHLMPLLSNAPEWQNSRSCSTSLLAVDKCAWPFLHSHEP